MKTPEKIFLCWSKRRSRSIATAWAALLPEVIKDIQPIVSTEFQKGRNGPCCCGGISTKPGLG